VLLGVVSSEASPPFVVEIIGLTICRRLDGGEPVVVDMDVEEITDLTDRAR
jgi:hypothetical protein